MRPKLGQTPSQTVGPFFSMRLGGEGQNILPVPEGAVRIVITGKVIDGGGSPVEDALIETWQADPSGRYVHPDDRWESDRDHGFTGFARAMTDFDTGSYTVETVKPGRVADTEGSLQAPHLSVVIQARGMLNPLFTRIYFSDEEEANPDDLVLRSVPSERRSTLIAELVPDSDPKRYRFDIRLHGEDETVFFDF